jgi:hypothetical protein
MMVTAGVAGAIFLSDGAPQRFSPQALQLFAAKDDHNQQRARCHSNEWMTIDYKDNCVFGAPGVEPVAAVWGDSAGAELVVALGEAAAERRQAVMQITSSGCPPSIDYQLQDQRLCISHNRRTLEHLAQDARIRTVVLAANFSRYPWQDQPRFRAGLTRSVETLTAAGKRVVLTQPPPNPWFAAPSALGLVAHRGGDLETIGISRKQYDMENREAISFLDDLARRTGAMVFRPADALCTLTFCPAFEAGTGVLYFNGNHISVTGARVAISRFPFSAFPAPGKSELTGLKGTDGE